TGDGSGFSPDQIAGFAQAITHRLEAEIPAYGRVAGAAIERDLIDSLVSCSRRVCVGERSIRVRDNDCLKPRGRYAVEIRKPRDFSKRRDVSSRVTDISACD